MTSGPATTAAMTGASAAPGLLEQLYGQIEVAWMQRCAGLLVDQLVTRYPEYRDELYDFLALLVDSALGESTQETLKSVKRTKAWLAEEGYGLAAQVAKDMRPHHTTTDPTDPKEHVEQVDVEIELSSWKGEEESEGTLLPGFMGLLQLRTHRTPQQLLDEIDVPDFILTFAQDNPPEETPEGARWEIVHRARQRGWIQEREGEEALERVLPRAAFRRTPYGRNRPVGAESTGRSRFHRYVDVINRSRLKKAKKRYWLAFAEEEDKGCRDLNSLGNRQESSDAS